MRKIGAAVTVAATLAMGNAAMAERSFGSLTGVWQSHGYGLVAEIDHDRLQFIERTAVSCLRGASYGRASLEDYYTLAVGADGESFSLRSDGALSAITFTRLPDMQQACPTGITTRSEDPLLNFDVMWHTFAEHYAFFAERSVDWDAMYDEFRPRAAQASRPRDLRRLMASMLSRFDDGHVSLETDRDVVDLLDEPVEAIFKRECRELGGACDYDDYYRDQIDLYNEIIRRDYLRGDAVRRLRGYATWGRLAPEVGYFRIDAMSGLSGQGTATADAAAIHALLDHVLAELDDIAALVIDVRMNEGGYDAVAVAIASRFADARRVFGSKHAIESGQRTPAVEMIVDPYPGRRFLGPVAVLIGPATMSAGEIFVLAMKALPNTRLIGEPTNGILSDNFYRTLPNGWEIGLSNEVYLDVHGNLFEARGIPPEMPAPFLSLADRLSRRDRGLDTALKTLETMLGEVNDENNARAERSPSDHRSH